MRAERRAGRKPRRQRIAMGRPLPLATDETAAVSDEDIERARAAWDRQAPPAFRGLLTAAVKAAVNFE